MIAKKLNALSTISRQRKQCTSPCVLFVIKFNGNILPALFRTPAQTISCCSDLGSTVAQATVGAYEEEQQLNEGRGGRSRKRRRTPFDQLTLEQQARRKETVRLENLKKKERRRQTKLSSSDSPGTSVEAPSPAQALARLSLTRPPSQPDGQPLLQRSRK